MPSSAQETALQAVRLAAGNEYGALNKLLSRTPTAWKSKVFHEVLHVPSLSRACLDVLFRHGLTASTPLGEIAAPPLLVCCSVNNLTLARYLVEQKRADLEGRDKTGRTALMVGLAAMQGNTELVRYLLDRGANVRTRNDMGAGAIHYAAEDRSVDALALLLDRGADANDGGGSGHTPLYIAARLGHMDAVRFLLDRGASEGPWPSICGAAAGGHIAIIELLLSHGRDINATDPRGWNALDWAIVEGCVSTVSFLLDRGATFLTHHGEDYLSVFSAIRNGSVEALGLLLDRGLPVLSIRNSWGGTCLHAAAADGNDTETLRFLLDRGMDVNVRAYAGSTPLHTSIVYGSLESVRLLLERGASLEVYGTVEEDSPSAATPLIAAVFRCITPANGVDPAPHLAVLELLLDHIDRSEDPARLVLMPGSDGKTMSSLVVDNSSSFASLGTRLFDYLPASLLPVFMDPEMLHGGFHPTSFDFLSFAHLLGLLMLRKNFSFLLSDWSSALNRLLNLFPSDLRPFESESDAVFVEALAFKVRELRGHLHTLLPAQCGKDWTRGRFACFRAGRLVQRRIEEVLARAVGQAWCGGSSLRT